MEKGAILSEDGKYRYKLWRIWDEKKPPVAFIGLNPSIADAKEDDPTIRKLITLSTNWGYGGFYIANLFALRSTDPAELKNVDDPIGPDNDKYIQIVNGSCDKTVLMYGNNGTLLDRHLEVLNILYPVDIYCVGLTNSGNPMHPLYMKGDSSLIKFDQSVQKLNQISMPTQQDEIIDRIVVYKINPNDLELSGEVSFDRNVNGRIFTDCLLTITNDTAILKDKDHNNVIGVFSLHHFYFLGD
jgi:hypothetical protein